MGFAFGRESVEINRRSVPKGDEIDQVRMKVKPESRESLRRRAIVDLAWARKGGSPLTPLRPSSYAHLF